MEIKKIEFTKTAKKFILIFGKTFAPETKHEMILKIAFPSSFLITVALATNPAYFWKFFKF